MEYFLDFFSELTWTELIGIHTGVNAGLEAVSVPSLDDQALLKGGCPKMKVVRGEGPKQKRNLLFHNLLTF